MLLVSVNSTTTQAATESVASSEIKLALAPRLASPPTILVDHALLKIVSEGATLRFVVTKADDREVHAEVLEDGVIMRFGAAIPGKLFETLPAQAPGWLRDLRYGYDSLFLRVENNVRIEILESSAEIEVRLARRPPPAGTRQSQPDEDDGSTLRLDRLSAVVRGRAGDYLGARAQLRAIMEANAGDVQTIIDLIEQERALGRWQSALALYDRALVLAPNAGFLIAGKASLLREQGPRLRFSYDLAVCRT